MSPLIQKIAKLASITFSNVAGKEQLSVINDKSNMSFAANMTNLKCLLMKLRVHDVLVDGFEVGDDQLSSSSSSSSSIFQRLMRRWTGHSHSRHLPDHIAPVAYTEIFEDETISIGIFILRGANVRIPLHDHPRMYGIIKVIHGCLTVDSYTAVQNPKTDSSSTVIFESAIPVKKLPQVVVDVNSEPCCLSPDVGNYHEIRAVDGPAAFVDILSPPYDHEGSSSTGSRECTFYRCERPSAGASAAGSVPFDFLLLECGPPIDFWSENILYSGPKVQI